MTAVAQTGLAPAMASPLRSHDLGKLAAAAGLALPLPLLDLQVYAVEARYEEGPFPLPASKVFLLALIDTFNAELIALLEGVQS